MRPATVVVAAVLLSACASTGLPGLDSGRSQAAVDAQTTATLEALQKVPEHVVDRQEFQRSAGRLTKLLDKLPSGQAPRDSGVLVYLARLAQGDLGDARHLSTSDETHVLRLCGPSHIALSRPHLRADRNSREEMLRQSCFTWLVGDGPKSRALYLRAKTEGAGNEPVVVAATPLDAFFQRLHTLAGIDLAARAGDGPQGLNTPLGGRPTATGEWMGRVTPR